MRLVLLGPPGAGKGTQADLLSNEFKLPHISTGDILRSAVKDANNIGLKAKAYMDKGELVPDHVVTEIVVDRLAKNDALNGFILDGYPRNEKQAKSLNTALEAKGISIDTALYLKTSIAKIVARLSGRRVCSKCNAIYHINNNPPRVEGVCNTCGGALYQRKDDTEDTIKKRLEVYNDTEKGLLDYYKNSGLLEEVSGDMDAKDLFETLKSSFKKTGKV